MGVGAGVFFLAGFADVPAAVIFGGVIGDSVNCQRMLVEAPLAEGGWRGRGWRPYFREEPETDGNLRAVEEPAGKGDHAVHEVGRANADGEGEPSR